MGVAGLKNGDNDACKNNEEPVFEAPYLTPFTCKVQVVSQERGVWYKWAVEEVTKCAHEAGRSEAAPAEANTEGQTNTIRGRWS